MEIKLKYKNTQVVAKKIEHQIKLNDCIPCDDDTHLPFWDFSEIKKSIPDEAKEMIISVLDEGEGKSKDGFNKHISMMNKFIGSFNQKDFKNRADFEQYVEEKFYDAIKDPSFSFTHDSGVVGEGGWMDVYKWACDKKGLCHKTFHFNIDRNSSYYFIPTVSGDAYGFSDRGLLDKHLNSLANNFKAWAEGEIYRIEIPSLNKSYISLNNGDISNINNDIFADAKDTIEKNVSNNNEADCKGR